MNEKKEFGFIQEFMEDPGSSTGYSITMLFNGKMRKNEISKSVYDMQFDPIYDFPLITETPRIPVYGEKGVIVELTKAVPGENINSSYAFGSPKTIGHVMRVENNQLIFKAKEFNEEMKNGHTVYYHSYYKGNARPVGDKDLALNLSDDAVILCLDWTKNEDRHSVKSMKFMEDVLNNKKNCHWISIYELHGQDLVYDCICLFLHHKKDENATGGDLSLDTRSGKERRKALTQGGSVKYFE